MSGSVGGVGPMFRLFSGAEISRHRKHKDAHRLSTPVPEYVAGDLFPMLDGPTGNVDLIEFCTDFSSHVWLELPWEQFLTAAFFDIWTFAVDCHLDNIMHGQDQGILKFFRTTVRIARTGEINEEDGKGNLQGFWKALKAVLWDRTRARAAEIGHIAVYNRLVDEIEKMLDNHREIIKIFIQETPPTVDEYLSLRVIDSGVLVMFVHMEILYDCALSETSRNDTRMLELVHCCAVHVSAVNDIYSYRLEEARLDDIGKNLVYLYMRSHGDSVEQATKRAVDFCNKAMERFEVIATDLLKNPADEENLENVAKYIYHARKWAYGSLVCHANNVRYIDPLV